MKIITVTITGADNAVKPVELLKISREFPFVEWGILLSKVREGSKRYPDRAWVQGLLNVGEGLKVSAHLCGCYVRDILKGEDTFPYKEVFNHFDRVQLNLGRRAEANEDFFKILYQWGKPIIFQMTGWNEHLFYRAVEKGIDAHVLYDASGGRGVVPKSWQPPIKGRICGYAGGLNPDNLREQIKGISEIVGDADIWIDTESGVRTNDDFDLAKVLAFLEIAKEFCG